MTILLLAGLVDTEPVTLSDAGPPKAEHVIEEAIKKTRQLGASSLLNVIGVPSGSVRERKDIVEAAVNSAGGEVQGRTVGAPNRGPSRRTAGIVVDVHVCAHDNWQSTRRASADPRSLGRRQLPARREAVSTLWHLMELRAEPIFIRLSSALDTEEEYSPGHGNRGSRRYPVWRPRTQRALSERLFDPSISVRYAALCAAGSVGSRQVPAFATR